MDTDTPERRLAEFVARWQPYVAGVIALGSEKVRRLSAGPIASVEQYGATMIEVGDTAAALVEKIARDWTRANQPAAGNGKPAPQPKEAGRGATEPK